MTTVQQQWWWRDARIALWALVAGDDDTAAAAVNRIIGRDSTVFGNVFVAWIDTMAAHLPSVLPGETVQILWMQEGADRVETADEVPPSIRWAGWLIQARMAMDEDQYRALIAGIETNEQATEYVTAVLTIAATTIRTVKQELAR